MIKGIAVDLIRSMLVFYLACAACRGSAADENENGFVLLSDGETFAGWEHKGNWEVRDGAFFRVGEGGPLTFTAALVPDDFDLWFEWKVSAGCNSGVYYRPGQYEYQILDNDGSPYGANARHSAGALFFCMAPDRDVTRPVGEWNSGRIRCCGSVIEHWVNGVCVLSFDYEDPRWTANVEMLELRGADLAARGGRLWLQDHGHEVWFRNLRWRELAEGEKLAANPDFRPLAVEGEALLQEQARVERLRASRRKEAGSSPDGR